MGNSKPNALHYGGFVAQKGNGFEQPLCFLKFNSFAGNAEIETETDTGHTGTRSLNLGEDRVSASASPEIEDRLRPEQGLEDYFYHALGAYTVETLGTKTKLYTFTPDPNANLPLVSILHAYNVDGEAPRGFANSIASELTLKMNSKEAPSVTCKYTSDFPVYGVPEPTLAYLANPPKNLKSGQLQAFMGEANAIDEGSDSMGCLNEAELTINNNVETDICAGTTLGEVNKDIGELTLEGSFTSKYNSAIANLERQWATGSSSGSNITYDSLFKSLRFRYTGELIESVTGDPATDYNYMLEIDLPKVDITSVKPSESGDGAKTVEVEFKALASLATSDIITVKVQSALSALHITV